MTVTMTFCDGHTIMRDCEGIRLQDPPIIGHFHAMKWAMSQHPLLNRQLQIHNECKPKIIHMNDETLSTKFTT